MSESILSLNNSASFRNSLLARNLPPYKVEGFFSSPYQNSPYEINQTIDSVIDSPEIETRANSFYPLNEYGPEGGYSDTINFNGPPKPVSPNSGVYDFTDTEIPEIGKFYINTVYNKSNIWTPEGGYNFIYTIQDSQLNNRVYQPYLPLYFTPSTYNAYDIYVEPNPQGNNGPLSADSYLAKISAQHLKFHISTNVAVELSINNNQKTGLDYLTDPLALSTDFNGNTISSTNNFKITIPDENDTYLNALQGTYFPTSPILGEYFSSPVRNIGTPGQLINVLLGSSTLLGGLLSGLPNRFITPSQLFLDQTGNGQKSILFSNINYNIYRPPYGNSILQGIGNNLAATALNSLAGVIGTQVPGAYYVGSSVVEPTYIASPLTDVPINAFGESVEAPVYGPTDLSELYEGNTDKLAFALGAKLGTNSNVDGNFTWTSPKYSPNAGKFVKPGGEIGKEDPAFNSTGVGTNYKKTESKEVNFKVGSILDDTQRLVESADRVKGQRRLKHVGNAINQVSKVFHDGYKEITKGSRVISYTNTNGNLVGEEYSRIFTKDSPYYTNQRLVKSDGITNSNRAFTYSVLDSPFNLNITPNKASDTTTSTNIIDGKVKKYMFSIENLAWRTTSMQFELPACERGPNGGRIMWFPPYDLTYSETSSIDFPGTTFLGRPEPIYTYKNTSRTGQLSFKIIVDYPSVLDVIASKVLEKEKDSNRINSVINSFFAGCVKFDIYELAAKYPTIPINLLLSYQQKLNDPRLTKEELEKIKNAQQGLNTSEATAQIKQTENNQVADFTSFQSVGFFYDINQGDSFAENISSYTDSDNKAVYNNLSETKDQTNAFFDKITSDFETLKTLIQSLYDLFQNNEAEVLIEMQSNLSPEEGDSQDNSTGRFDLAKEFFATYQLNSDGDNPISLSTYVEENKLRFKSLPAGSSIPNVDVNCSQALSSTATDGEKYYNLTPMACRSVIINKITVNQKPANAQNQNLPTNNAEPTADNPNGNSLTKPTSSVDLENLRPGIAKKIIRALLNEGTYFEAIKKENPFIYDNIKERLKYFNPVFHSMTPEGLNSRVTFLNQCIRPGQTIPTIVNGQPSQNVATNTAFGAPPVLVLRIGDFYNTKIIPTSLSIQPDGNTADFDLNPEGIGVQPLILKVSLNFNYIGGSGLAAPIDELQNALSFNYYANTEIYDERATATEDTSEIDKKLVKKILGDQKPKVEKPLTQQSNAGDTTIGVQSDTKVTSSGETGVLTYDKIFDSFLDETKNYYTNTFNQIKTINDTYNFGIVQLMSLNRQYNIGKFNEFGQSTIDVNIFGKPEKIQEKLDGLFSKIVEDVEVGDNEIVAKFIDSGYDIDGDVTRVIVQNLTNYVNGYKSNFPTEIFNAVQKFTEQQQTWVQFVRKLNFVLTNSDGKLNSKNESIIFNLSATSSNSGGDTFTELNDDYTQIAEDTNEYWDEIYVNLALDFYSDVDYIYDLNQPDLSFTENRFYQVFSKIFKSDTDIENFKNQILTSDITNTSTTAIMNQVLADLKSNFDAQRQKDNTVIDNFTNGVYTTKFVNYNPFSKNKGRKFDYSSLPSGTDEQKNRLSDLYKTINVNSDPSTFDGKIQFN